MTSLPADPFTSGHALTDLLEEGHVLLLALGEAAARGALGPALDALVPDELRMALLSWLVDVRRALRARMRREGHLTDTGTRSEVRHFEAGDTLRDLMILAAGVEHEAARRIALRLEALPDAIIEVLIEDVLQVRR